MVSWKNVSIFFLALVCVFSAGSFLFAAETSVPKDYSSLDWSYGGESVPETYWTPWLPLGAQQFTRYKVGFRFSTGTIAVKAPVKVTFKYDAANAKSGGDVAIKIKPELQPATFKTFESAFGLHLPNVIQIGFIGITGIPDILPWFDLPWDMCELLGKIPGLPKTLSDKVGVICRTIENVGVNMETKDALPLPGSASYHDVRTLLEIAVSDFLTDQKKQDMGIKIYNALSDKLGDWGMLNVLTAIQIAKGLNEAGATEYLTDLCVDVVDKLSNFAKITIIGDPYFTVEGVELSMMVRVYIPGGKGSGTYPLVFTSSGEEKTITFRDITPFVTASDKLKIVIDSMAYRFKLKQGLIPKIGISVFPEIPIPKYEKYVALVSAKKDFTESDNVVEIPLTPSTDLVQSRRVNTGAISAQVIWTTPIIPMKGIVKTYDGDKLVKTITESTFRDVHSIIVTDLTPEKTYKFVMECQNPNGQTIQAGELTATTKKASEIPDRLERTTCGPLSFTNPVVTAGKNYIDFAWSTNQEASSEVMYSPSPDLGVNYVIAMKKKDGQVIQGWGTRGGEREFATYHTMRVIDLEPDTTYYYNIRSWTFNKNPQTNLQDESKDPLDAVGYMGQIKTLPAPPPTIKIKAEYQGQAVSDATVHIYKVGDASFHVSLTTGADGFTQSVALAADSSYTFSIKDQAGYQDITSPARNIPRNTEGELSSEMLYLTARQSPGGNVYDTAGNPIVGASVKIVGGSSMTTNAQGHYTINGLTKTGPCDVEISKSRFITKRVPGRVEKYGHVCLFSADDCVLENSMMDLAITVKKIDGSPLADALLMVKEGGTTIQNLYTDAQGKANFQKIYTENKTVHNLVVEVSPAEGTGAVAGRGGIPMVGGESQALEIYCLSDTQGPAVSDIYIWSDPSHIQFEFKSTEKVSHSMEYKDPAGQTGQTAWSAYPAVQNFSTMTYSAWIEQNLQPGLYKFRMKAKDQNGNMTQTDWVEYKYFPGGASWNLRVKSKTASSVTLEWDMLDSAPSFKEYSVRVRDAATNTAVLGGVISIANNKTTTQTFNNLEFGKTYKAEVTAYNNTGSTSYAQGDITFQLSSMPPVIQSFDATPPAAALNQAVSVSATIADPDSNVKKATLYSVAGKKKEKINEQTFDSQNVTYSHTFTPKQAGKCDLELVVEDEASPGTGTKTVTVVNSEKPVIAFDRIPSQGKVNKEFRAAAKIMNAKTVTGDLSCSVDWGDGKQSTLDKRAIKDKNKGVLLAHTYNSAGTFTIQATFSTTVEGISMSSEPISSEVAIALAEPEAEFTRVTQDGPNAQTFHIKASAGSYPIQGWALDFGDGTPMVTGTDAVDKDEQHYYRLGTKGKVKGSGDVSKQPYQAVFSVTDNQGTKTEKIFVIQINQDGTTEGSQALQAGQLAGDNLQALQKQTTQKSTTTTIRPPKTTTQTLTKKTTATGAIDTKVTAGKEEVKETVAAEAEKIEEKVEEKEAETKQLETTATKQAETTAAKQVESTVTTKAAEEKAGAKQVTVATTKQKAEIKKIVIKKLLIEGVEKGILPEGKAVTALVDIDATHDFDGPFAVALTLKGKEAKQIFEEGIKKLQKGLNSFKWDVTDKTEPGQYTLTVEVMNEELKLKDKEVKTFKVVENKE